MSRSLRAAWLACGAVLLAGCGAGAAGGGADGDPASVVPANARVYLEGPAKPEGAQREGLLAAAGKVLRTPEPERRLRELLDQAGGKGDGPDVDYERDVEPWAGKRMGTFVEDFEAEEPSVLTVVAAADADRAADAVDAVLARERAPVREASHKGVEYRVTREKIAVGMIGDFVAFGDEKQFRRAVEAAEGDSLAEAKAYRDTIAGLDEGRIGTAYVDVKSLIAQALREDPEARAQLDQVKGLLELDRLAPIGMALLADGKRIALDTVASSAGAGALIDQLSLLSGNGTTPLLGEVPADSWLALGAPKVGASLQALFDKAAGAIGGAAIAAQVEQETGLRLREDVFSWVGDMALFVRGTDQASLDGALVIGATDAAKARSAVTKLIGVATRRAPGAAPRPVRVEGAETAFSISTPGSPQPAIVAIAGDRVVVAYGERAARAALAPEAELSEAPAFQAAKETLGGDAEPSLFLAMPALLGVIDSGVGAGDPEWAKAKPYLEALSAVVSGGERDGDRQRSRVAVGLK